MLAPQDHVLEIVDDYLHGLLADADAAVLEEHCEHCPICRVGLEEARRRFAAVTETPLSEVSEKLVSRALSNVDTASRGSGRLDRPITFNLAYALAACVLVLATLHWFVYRLSPSPYDLRVLGQRELLAGSRAALRLAVFHRRTGQQVADVPVEIHLFNSQTRERLPLARVNTSDSGAQATQFTLPENWPPGEYELQVTATTSDGLEVIKRPVTLRREWNIMLSTDKPVYQPGQTVLMRALGLRRPDLKPLAGQAAEFEVRDPKGNIIFRARGSTSRFGIVAAECALDSEAPAGAYQLECRVGDSSARRTLEVQSYVLPKFQVTLQPEKPFYAPGETVRGTLEARYFFGQPVVGGQGTLEVRALDVPAEPLATLNLETNAEGKAAFEFPLPATLVGREQAQGLAAVVLHATVEDSAGQRHVAQRTTVVAREPLLIDVLPENGALVAGVANTVYVMVRYADGRPAVTQLEVSGRSGQLPTSESGVAEFSLTPESEGVSLHVRATDAAGLSSQRQVVLRCGEASGDFLLRANQAVYQGGQTVELAAAGGGGEPIFVDLLKDGQTILTETLEMHEGQGSLEFELPENAFGTLELVAYRFSGAGLAVRKRQVLYVRQPNSIVMNATLDRDEYRPGGKARLNITLRNEKNQPTPGAVSLAAVDEAVFSVLPRAAGLDPTFLLLEERLLEPVYQIYENWSPATEGRKPSTDRLRLERALFASTARVRAENAVPAPFMGLEEGPVAADELYSLSGTSFPAKQRSIERRRSDSLRTVSYGWGLLGLAAAGWGLLALFSISRVAGAVVSGVLGLGVMIGLLALPATKMARDLLATSAGPVVKSVGAVRPRADAADATQPEAAGPGAAPASESSPPRVRRHFPETMLWRPEIITDNGGSASVEIDLADSITTWRLSGSAVAAGGQLGAGQWPLKVFQPFFVDLNLPPALTRNDDVDVPAVVYNYSGQELELELELLSGDWFELRSNEAQPAALKHTLKLAAGEVRAQTLPLRIKRAGTHRLLLAARGGGASDAIEREVEVSPDGRRLGDLANGTLDPSALHVFSLPENAIETSARCVVKIYPSTFSQLVEGIDAIFKMPSGCFEQTSSTTYPNVLALAYLRGQKGKKSPEIEAKARQFIHLGYQRLVTFEVPEGGFDWFGHAPGKLTLTAYGLMEFEDMARVHDVDSRLLARTRAWLLKQRLGDGSWVEPGRTFRAGAAGEPANDHAGLLATAYVAWAVFGNGHSREETSPTLAYLLQHKPEAIDNPYVVALVASAVAGIDRDHERLPGYLERLEKLKQTSADGKHVWWDSPLRHETVFYGSGRSGQIETTAQAVLALLASDAHTATVRRALAWLASQRDPRGTWHSTQATVLTLKALLAGGGESQTQEPQRDIEVLVNDQLRHKVIIRGEDSDVVRTIDLSDDLVTGENRVRLEDTSRLNTRYQIFHRYHVPDKSPPAAADPLAITVTYDRARLAVDERVVATATVKNNLNRPAPMVILDLPIPGGFTLEPGELDEWIGSRTIERYQLSPRKAILYLRELPAEGTLELRYRLRATMPVKVLAPAAQAYLYYTPEEGGQSQPLELEAVAAPSANGAQPPQQK